MFDPAQLAGNEDEGLVDLMERPIKDKGKKAVETDEKAQKIAKKKAKKGN